MCFMALGSTGYTNDLLVNIGGAVHAFLVRLFDFSKTLEITEKWLFPISSKHQLFAINIILRYK